MKKILLFAAILTATLSVKAQCDDIFISEYVEGTYNNKALELYNPTDEAIDLSGYQLERFSNGSDNAEPNQRYVLSGTIEPYGTYVFVIDKRDPDGTGTEAPVWQDLQDQADQFICPDYSENNAIYFNGNDALVIRKLPNEVVDVFGVIDQNPEGQFGGGWNNIPPSYQSGINGGIPWTEDHTMIRKFNVTGGITSPPSEFNTEIEWDSLPANTFENLGEHFCSCDPTSVEETSSNQFSVYPNPSKGEFYINADQPLKSVVIYDLNGREVYRKTFESLQTESFISANLPSGIFMIKGRLNDNRSVFSKVVIK